MFFVLDKFLFRYFMYVLYGVLLADIGIISGIFVWLVFSWRKVSLLDMIWIIVGLAIILKNCVMCGVIFFYYLNFIGLGSYYLLFGLIFIQNYNFIFCFCSNEFTVNFMLYTDQVLIQFNLIHNFMFSFLTSFDFLIVYVI